MNRIDVIGADHFTTSARRIVDYLNTHTPISDWSVSRVTGGEQVHLHVHHEDLLESGDRVAWETTFCRRMTLGAAHIVPDSLDDPDYADLGAAPYVRAYAGYPISDDDGSTFGILCGVNSQPLADVDGVDKELLELMSDLLSSQLAVSRAADRERREAEIASALAHTDELTGLLNRRGWDAILQDAQQRVDAYGDLVAIVVIDLDGLKAINDEHGHQAGDAVLQAAARALSAVGREGDRIARYGGDEFCILVNNVPLRTLEEDARRFGQALAAVGISAAVGSSPAVPGGHGLADAFAAADAVMYEIKRSSRTA